MAVGPVMDARETVFANRNPSRSLVPGQHKEDGCVGKPGAQTLVVGP